MKSSSNKTKRTLIIAGIALGVLLAGIGAVALISSMNNDSKDPYKQKNIENTPASTNDTPNKPSDSAAKNDQKKQDAGAAESEASTLDPASLRTITVDPMGITVSYVKDATNFEFFVKRTPSGTQYVEFKSEQLVGTKCTDDQGVFASIIAKPGTAEAATLTKKTTIDGVEYGLSLAAQTCAPDADLLKTYQDSFSQAFSLLKRADS